MIENPEKIYLHELKNILLRLSLLSENIEDKELKKKIEKELISIDKLAKSHFSKEKFDLIELVKELSETRDIKVKKYVNKVFTELNYEKIKMLIGNIISNQDKYGKKIKKINFILKDNFVIEFINDGVTPDENEIDLLFEFGNRSRKVLDSYSGDGVGLFIAKKIANEVGVDISYKVINSENNISLTFRSNSFYVE